MIIGLMGRKRSGKDTVASALIEYRGFRRTAFADRMKDSLLAVNPYLMDGDRLHNVVRLDGWEAAKNRPDVRRLLQEFGSALREQIDPDIWIAPVEREVRESIEKGGNLVISDVRYPNEATMILKHGGYLLNVERPGSALDDMHPSEAAIPVSLADATLVNDSSIDELIDKATRFYDSAYDSVFD